MVWLEEISRSCLFFQNKSYSQSIKLAKPVRPDTWRHIGFKLMCWFSSWILLKVIIFLVILYADIKKPHLCPIWPWYLNRFQYNFLRIYKYVLYWCHEFFNQNTKKDFFLMGHVLCILFFIFIRLRKIRQKN